MNKTELKDKINSFLSSVILSSEEAKAENKIELMQSTLEDGMIVEYTVLFEGDIINIVAEDGTLTPLVTGEYVIEGNKVTVIDGIIDTVIPVEAPAEEDLSDKKIAEELAKEKEQIKEVNLKSDYDAKVLELKTDYDAKLDIEKEKFKLELEKLAEEVKDSTIVQAPVEDNTPKVALTTKEKMQIEIARKRKQ